MNEKVNDLLIRLSKIPSATSLATELRSVLKTECVVIDREWLKENIKSVKVYDREDGKVEETYEFRVRCIVNDRRNDPINDWKCESMNGAMVGYPLTCDKWKRRDGDFKGAKKK